MKARLVKMMLALFVVSLIVLTGCTNDKTNNINDNEIKEPSDQNLPGEIQEWVENSRNINLGQTYEYDGKLYILVTYGEKPTGGYAVEITEVRELNEVMEIEVEFTKPEPGQVVTDAITNPYDLIDIEPTGKEIKFVAAGAEIHVPILWGLDRLEPIVAGEKGVMVFEPAPDSKARDNKIIFRGITNTFEGTANYRIKSGSQLVQEGFVTGSMGDWGYFSEVLELPENIFGPLTFEIFVISAKDGQELDKFIIPLVAGMDAEWTGPDKEEQEPQKAFPAVQLLPIDESADDPEFKEFLESMMASVKQKDVAAFEKHLADDFSYSFGHDLGLKGFKEYWELDQNPAESELWEKLTVVIEMGGTFVTLDEASYFLAPYVFSDFPVDFNEFEFAAIISENVPVFMEPDKGSEVLEHLDYYLIRLLDNSMNFDTWVKIETPNGKIGYVEGVNLRSPLDYKAGFVKKDDNWQMIYFIAGD